LTYARRRLIARGATHIALYIWRDDFAEALDCVEHDVSCYHIDDEYSFSEQDVPNSPREVALLRRVDQVIVHSSALMRKKGGINPHTALVPNGVDFAAFSRPRPIPADLASIPEPRIGYAGVIKKQLDLGLLVRLAQARPNYSFVLVGPILNVAGKQAQIEALKKLPNVHFLGAKPVDDLPAYVQYFDVCLLCYEVNDYTNHIYPLKLNEYLATGRPAVAAPIETLRGLDVVSIANSDDEWLAKIDGHLHGRDLADGPLRRRIEFARQHDWNALVDRVAGLLSEALARATARTQ
jgi:glycosyltransferase involved in cell wall biosynthesis